MYVYDIQAYEKQDEDKTLHNVVVVRVYADTEEAAIEEAKKRVKKNHYRISFVGEHTEPIDLSHKYELVHRLMMYYYVASFTLWGITLAILWVKL